ncbi:phosphodiester glycosidase family protein [Actinoplanes sp. G11-F43]|uniref:phosphodiester glycosidase family protein n=1 Tax=Actinoplanes sp. G11-F43 TaxID=3424130 RepID=UPI003D337A8E
MRLTRTAFLLAGLTAATGAIVLPASPASAAITVTAPVAIAPGLGLRTVNGTGAQLKVQVFEADLTTPTLGVRYLSGATVSRSTAQVSTMAAAAKAVAAVNGDFWDGNVDGHTDAPNGMAISDGTLRSGRALTTGDYHGVAAFTPSGTGTLAEYVKLYLKASVTPAGGAPIAADQLNAPLLIKNGVGIYSELWGSADRAVTTSGSTPVREVVITNGVVTKVNNSAGGAVAPGSVVLVGTGAGVEKLAGLVAGTAVTVDYRPVTASGAPASATVAIGASDEWILLENGAVKTFTNTTTRPRTAIGFSADGTKIWMLVADGYTDKNTKVQYGMTFAQAAQALKALGADDAISLDGGGSSKMVARQPGATAVSVIGGDTLEQREVPSGLGLTSSARSTDCSASANIFAVNPDGTMLIYGLKQPSILTPTWEYVNGKNPVGFGWNQFGKILAGPRNQVFGINAGGLFHYVWNGEGVAWTKTKDTIGAQFAPYALPEWKDKITVDRAGDFYRVDGSGNLIRSRLDATTLTWTLEESIDTGWDQYDKVIAADAGVLYARAKSDGKLYRYHYDTTTRSWVTKGFQAGAGWQQFQSGVFSAGGNTLFGIVPDGATNEGHLLQYRHREWNNAWAITANKIGNGWQDFADVAAAPDACRLTADVYRP